MSGKRCGDGQREKEEEKKEDREVATERMREITDRRGVGRRDEWMKM